MQRNGVKWCSIQSILGYCLKHSMLEIYFGVSTLCIARIVLSSGPRRDEPSRSCSFCDANKGDG